MHSQINVTAVAFKVERLSKLRKCIASQFVRLVTVRKKTHMPQTAHKKNERLLLVCFPSLFDCVRVRPWHLLFSGYHVVFATACGLLQYIGWLTWLKSMAKNTMCDLVSRRALLIGAVNTGKLGFFFSFLWLELYFQNVTFCVYLRRNFLKWIWQT